MAEAPMQPFETETKSDEPRLPAPPGCGDVIVPASTTPSTPCDSVGTAVTPSHRFTIERLHAKGGLGQVSVARDTQLNRAVALKEIRPDRRGEEARRRFLVEAEITGQLEHPGIVPIYALETDASGEPYYAMRFIEGESLADAIKRFHGIEHAAQASAATPVLAGASCSFYSLAFRQLLQRFVSVCQTVAYAHNKGVIHRDLKPANVMLGDFGETLVVDWGLAKRLADDKVTRRRGDKMTGTPEESAPFHPTALLPTLLAPDDATKAGEALGTPAYMAPEQARAEWEQVGTAADIFSLGANLYEMLTGRGPFQGSSASDALERAKAGSFAPPQRLQVAVPKVLEAICLKAMAADPAERYGTAAELADDVSCWLADEPVHAYAEPWTMRLRRWGRKHRPIVVTAAAALVTATIGLAFGLLVVNAEKNRTELARLAEHQAKLDAEAATIKENAAKVQAQQRLVQIDKGVELFAGLLADINPRNEEKNGPPLYQQLRERAKKAADELDAESVADPQAVARLQTILGNTLRNLGESTKAIEVLEKARVTRERELGIDHLDTLTTRQYLAAALHAGGKLPQAIALYEAVRDTYVRKLGAQHPEARSTMNNLALAYKDAGKLPQAIALFEQVHAAQLLALGAGHRDTVTTLNNLALAYQDADQLPQAIAAFEQVRDARVQELGAKHPDTLLTLNNLARAYVGAGKLPQAIALFEQVRDSQLPKLGPDHPDTVLTLNNLAGAYFYAGKLPQAIALFEQVRDVRVRKQGVDHPETLVTLDNLAWAYLAADKATQAIALFEQVRDARLQILGADHPDTLTTLNNLAGAYLKGGKLPQAIALYEQVRDAVERKLGADHVDTLLTQNNLGAAYRTAGKMPEAIALFEQTRDAMVRKLGADHPHTLTTIASLARTYAEAGRAPDALPLFEQAAVGIERRQFMHEHAAAIIPDAVQAYEAAGQLDKAESWRRKWLEVVKARAGTQSAAYAGELVALGLNLLHQKKWTEGEELLRNCLAIRDKLQPDEWTTWSTKSMLGEALLGQQKYAGAEPLLIAGYHGLKEREAKIPPQGRVRLTEALERLVHLYDTWGKPDEAAKWKKALDESKFPAGKSGS